MKIKVKLFASYRIGRFKEAELDYPAGVSVGELLQSLDIVAERQVIVLVNGKRAEQSQLLCAGDTLTILPLVSGG